MFCAIKYYEIKINLADNTCINCFVLKGESMDKKQNNFPIEFNSMFREYDIRGRVNDTEMCPENVYRIVKAYCKYLQKRNITKAVVGYDNRDCSIALANSAIKALRDAGIDVYFIGLTLTPIVYWAQYFFKSEGAVMITASHNPNGWSGFKLAKGYSKTLESFDIVEVFNYLDEELDIKPTKLGNLVEQNVRDEYISDVVSKIKMGDRKIKVVTEGANGGAGLFMNEVFERLGCLTFQLNAEPDVTYPKYFPNPSNIDARKSMIEMVKHPYVKADLGVFLDGDGDRIGVVDNNGNNIWSDMILAILSKQLLKKKGNAKIVYDVKCSKALEEVILKYGGTPIMWKTGHSYIKAKMHEVGADLAGERSGHIFVGGDDYYAFDDAVFVAAKLIEYLSWSKKSLAEEIDEFPKYVTTPEIKASCKDELKYGVIDKVTETFKSMFPNKVCDINGARVQFENGWGLIRASSNLPEVVIIIEADTMEHVKEIRKTFKDVLKNYPEISSNWDNDIE